MNDKMNFIEKIKIKYSAKKPLLLCVLNNNVIKKTDLDIKELYIYVKRNNEKTNYEFYYDLPENEMYSIFDSVFNILLEKYELDKTNSSKWERFKKEEFKEFEPQV